MRGGRGGLARVENIEEETVGEVKDEEWVSGLTLREATRGEEEKGRRRVDMDRVPDVSTLIFYHDRLSPSGSYNGQYKVLTPLRPGFDSRS